VERGWLKSGPASGSLRRNSDLASKQLIRHRNSTTLLSLFAPRTFTIDDSPPSWVSTSTLLLHFSPCALSASLLQMP
jgi:hypothetical protein